MREKLLKYEFLDVVKGSINDGIKQLVRRIRFLRSNVSIDEFKAEIPELKKIELGLQNFDKSIGDEKVFYIEQILNELDEETKKFEDIQEEIENNLQAFVMYYTERNINTDEIKYKLVNISSIYTLELNIDSLSKMSESNQRFIRQLITGLCYKYGFIYIEI